MFNLDTHKKKLKEVFSRLFQKNKYEKDLADYMELAETHPKDMRIRLRIAETFVKARNAEKAIETFKQVAEYYEGENFMLKAVAMYKNIIKLNPGLVETNLKLAGLYEQLGMPTDVINQYRIVMETYATQENKEKVIETCQKLVELDPSVSNRRKLAEIYQTHGTIRNFVPRI